MEVCNTMSLTYTYIVILLYVYTDTMIILLFWNKSWVILEILISSSFEHQTTWTTWSLWGPRTKQITSPIICHVYCVVYSSDHHLQHQMLHFDTPSAPFHSPIGSNKVVPILRNMYTVLTIMHKHTANSLQPSTPQPKKLQAFASYKMGPYHL